jgi:hypothetical protein
MKTSKKLLLSGAVIISLSLIVFGTDAVLSLITFYQNLENPSARELAEGISDSIGSALFGVALVSSEYVPSLLGLSVSFSKSVLHLTGILP